MIKNRKFKYAKANNFLCFGKEGIEIDFKALGNIVHICGINHDTEGDKSASNGLGKSSVPEIPVYALFGKTIKRPKKLGHADIVHNCGEADLYTEFQWDDYRIVRTREAGKNGKGSVRLWQSAEGIWTRDTEITVGGRGMQKQIEDKIGLNYETFVNVYIFGDDSTNSFLECDTGNKREIIENLLSLEKYRVFHEIANDFFKDLKKQAKEALKDYETQQEEVTVAKKRIAQIQEQEEQWTTTKNKEYADLLLSIEKLKGRLLDSGVGKALLEYQEAQIKIASLNAKIPDLESTRLKIDQLVSGAMPKFEQCGTLLDTLSKQVRVLDSKISTYAEQIEKGTREVETNRNNAGKDCPFCKQEIDSSHCENIVKGLLASIQRLQADRMIVEDEHSILKKQFDADSEIYKKMQAGFADGRKKIQAIDRQISEINAEISRLSKIKEPQAKLDEIVIQKELESLSSQAEAKKTELASSPYLAIMEEATKELTRREGICQKKRQQVLDRDRDIPYLDFWTKAFGDKGIRKYVIDGIIPTLNKRIAHWLQFLVDNKIKLTLDNELNETVDRYPFDGRPYIYDGLSHGQRRRLMLALAQSFAYIMTLNCGSCPSALFLDEVTMNMDEPGVEGIYRMICELAKERQVFVIDHNKNLMQKLSGCDTITLEMRNGVTRRLK